MIYKNALLSFGGGGNDPEFGGDGGGRKIAIAQFW